MSTKIVKLTPANVEALELMAPGHTSLVETTKTTATFVGLTAREALGVVARMQETAGERYGRRGGAYQSLHAVIRKLETAVRDADAEQSAATDPLVRLLTDTETVAEALGTSVENLDRDFPVTSPAYGAPIAPTTAVTAHVHPNTARKHAVKARMVAEQAAAGAEPFRTGRPGAGVSGRLLAASKTGQRRPRRGRR